MRQLREILRNIAKNAGRTGNLCPECGKAGLKRKVSAPRFQLKGSGWYVTDFKNKDKSSAKTDTNTSAESEGGSKAEESTPAPEAPKTDAKTNKKEES